MRNPTGSRKCLHGQGRKGFPVSTSEAYETLRTIMWSSRIASRKKSLFNSQFDWTLTELTQISNLFYVCLPEIFFTTYRFICLVPMHCLRFSYCGAMKAEGVRGCMGTKANNVAFTHYVIFLTATTLFILILLSNCLLLMQNISLMFMPQSRLAIELDSQEWSFRLWQ